MRAGANSQPSPQDRAKRWLTNARITAAVASNVANQLAGPVAQPSSGETAKPTVDVTQRVQRDAERDWAKQEQLRRNLAAGELSSVQQRRREPGR
jgi:hypothetical protein